MLIAQSVLERLGELKIYGFIYQHMDLIAAAFRNPMFDLLFEEFIFRFAFKKAYALKVIHHFKFHSLGQIVNLKLAIHFKMDILLPLNLILNGKEIPRPILNDAEWNFVLNSLLEKFMNSPSIGQKFLLIKALCYVSTHRPFIVAEDVLPLLKLSPHDENTIKFYNLVSCYLIYCIIPKKDEYELISISRILKSLLAAGSTIIFELTSYMFGGKVSDIQRSLHKSLGCEIPLRGGVYQYFREIISAYFGTTDLIQIAYKLPKAGNGIALIQILEHLFHSRLFDRYNVEMDILLVEVIKMQTSCTDQLMSLLSLYCDMFQVLIQDFLLRESTDDSY